MHVTRGDVYYVYLDPVFGKEMGGYKPRPVAVISINDVNQKSLPVTVVPASSTERERQYRNIVPVHGTQANGLDRDTYFQCHQVRAIDRARFMGRRIGTLSRDDLARVEAGVRYCLGLL